MIKKTAKCSRKVALIMFLVMVLTSFAGIGPAPTPEPEVKAATLEPEVKAATNNGIITGGEGSYSTTLSTGETAEMTVKDCVLTVKVDGKNFNFKGNLPIVGMTVTNVPDDLLHIFLLSNKYYCMCLRTGIIIEAYRNASNGKYCLKTNASGYEVFGSSIINTQYFYEYVAANSVSRERLITRAEFDNLSNRKDPSVDEPTPVPTEEPTEKPTQAPTQKPTKEPTQAPTQKPTQASTVAPTQKPIEESTQKPTQMPTLKPEPTVPTLPTLAPIHTENPKASFIPTSIPIKTPDVEIDTHTEFDFDFWWEQVQAGIITWEQFLQVLWKDQWKVESKETEKETIYYFYDETGKLIRTERVLVSNGTQSGEGVGSAQVQNQGSATVQTHEKGQGEVKGTVDTQTKIVNNPSVVSKSSTKKSKKGASKVSYYASKHGNRIYLYKQTVKTTVNAEIKVSKKKVSLCLFDEKKRRMDWNGFKKKNIKKCQFVKKSHHIVVIWKKKGKPAKVKVYPSGGKTKKVKTLKIKNAIALKCKKGLAYAVVCKDGKVVSLKGKAY